MTKFSRWAKGLLVLLLLCLPLSRLTATTYYVKPGGNNNLDGRSWANAWAHPNKTNGSISRGDTVVFAAGEWDTCFVKPPTSGSGWTVYTCSSAVAAATVLRSGVTLAAGTGNWTQFSGNVYSYNTPLALRWNRWLSDGDGAAIQNYQVLKMQTSTSLLEGEAYFNTSTRVLYVYARGGGNPGNYNMNYTMTAVFHLDHEDMDSVIIEKMTCDGGAATVISISDGGSLGPDNGAPDDIIIRDCIIQNSSSTEGAFNQSLIYAGRTFDAGDPSEWAHRVSILRDTLRYCKGFSDVAEHAGAGLDMYVASEVLCSASVFINLDGTAINFKNGYSYDVDIDNSVIIDNYFSNVNTGIRVGAHTDSILICGNIITNCTYRGIDIHSSAGTPQAYYRVKIFNNTLWNAAGSGDGEAIIVSPTAASRGSDNEIRYNIVFDTTTVERAVAFHWQDTDVPLQSPSVQTYWDADSNLYYMGSSSFICRFISGSGCTGTNWSSWQSCGFDPHGLSTTNPNFAQSQTPTRAGLTPNNAPGMNRTYAGRTWTQWGAVQPQSEPHSPKWHDIDQIWHDAHDGLVNAAHGFASGDTLNFIENVYCRNKKWGLVVQVPVLILGNGYALHPDSVALNTIANNSFETPDVDPTRAASWDFTDAPNISRMFGHYHVVTELTDEPSLWEGDYALRVQLPCATQTVKTASSYQFASKTHHAIEFAYLNVADANVRVTVGLLNANGDTAYSAKNNVGTMERGSEPVWVHFMTKDTVETYKIFIQITGGDAAASSNQVFFDHVLHTTFRNFGIALEPDTCTLDLDWMDNQRFYNPATGLMETDPGLCFSSTASNREFWGLGVQGGVAEGTVIRDLRIEPIQPSLFFRGIYGAYGCSDITIKKATIKPMGSNPMGVMTWNGVRWDIDSTDVIFPEEPLDYHYSKRESVPSVGFNLRADKNNYGYSSKVSYCKVYNYPYQGVYITTRRDMTSDHVLQYPQNIVEYCEFYPRTLITNGFAIEDYGNAPSIIRYNRIFGAGQYHGTGIHVTTKQVDIDSLQWSIVEGNVGTVESYPYNQEYPYGNLAYGFQHEGVPLCSLRYNYLTALAIDPAAPAVDGMRITRSGSFKLFMHDNTFRGLSTGNVTGAALHLYSPTWSFDPAADVFDCYHNDFITNGVALRSVGVNSVGLQFKDCFFDYLDTLTAPNWKKMKSGENAYLPARDLRFIDNRYGDAEADSAFERTMMFGAYNYLSTADNGTEWFVSWSTTINSSLGGVPLEGDSVFIVSAQGDTLVRGATNAAGQLITVVDEFRDSAATTTYNQPVDRTQYNPYVLKVRHSGLELEQQVWIDGKKTINFNFSNDLSSLFKRKKRILE